MGNLAVLVSVLLAQAGNLNGRLVPAPGPDGGVILKRGCFQLPDGFQMCGASSFIAGTTASMQLFVDPAIGSDNGKCTSSGVGACATIPAAYAKMPKLVRHPVTVSMACGTYDAGAFVEGDVFAYNPALSGSYTPDAGLAPLLLFTGTMQNVTPATGPGTGTLSSATAGSPPPTTWGTFTLNSAGWTVNDLANKFITITSGTAAGESRAIVSNTSSTGTIAGTWNTTPDSTSHFAIQLPCTHIKDGLSEEPNLLSLFNSGGPGPEQSGAAFIVREAQAAPMILSPQVVIQNVDVQVKKGGDGLLFEGPGTNALIQNVTLTNAGGTANTGSGNGFIAVENGAMASVQYAICTGSVAENCINNSYQGMLTGAYGQLTTFGNILSPASGSLSPEIIFGGTAYNAQNQYTCGGGVIACQDVSGAYVTEWGSHFVDVGPTGYGVFVDDTVGGGAMQLIWYQNQMTGPSSNSTEAFFFSGANSVTLRFITAGTTITNFGYAFYFGAERARVQSYSGNTLPTVTGSVNADIALYGFTATGFYSMANLNALTPATIADLATGNAISNTVP